MDKKRNAILAILFLASLFLSTGNTYAETDYEILTCTKAIELYPNNPMEYINRGFAYLMKSSPEKAISDFNKAIGLDRKLPEAYYGRGVAYQFAGKFDAAIMDFTKALELKPGYYEAYNGRIKVYLQEGKYERAWQDVRAAKSSGVQIDSEAVEALKRASATEKSGDVYAETAEEAFKKGIGYTDKAIAEFDKAIQINPSYADAYYKRGLAYVIKGDLDKAWQDIHKAEELGAKVDPKFLEALKEMSGRDK